jgi:hypothetical protein
MTAYTGEFTIEVDMAQNKFEITFVVRPGLTVTSPVPPEMTVGEAYQFMFTAQGGSGMYNWLVTGGQLPPGLSLSIGGLLNGTPSQTGSYQAEITVSG